jgi:flagellar hook assembly protein FlgD
VVRLQVYDLIGRRVRSLLDESKSVGYYRVLWNGRDEGGKEVASGVYVYGFTATPIYGGKGFKLSGKLLLAR